MTTRPVAITVLALIAACEKPATPPAAAPPFTSTTSVKELMAQVVEPAANVYWESVGTVIDKNGEHELAPKTDTAWILVRNAATIVAESGNLLMIAPRAANNALVAVGKRARGAAEAKDKMAVFDVGAEVYQACVNCHSKYMPGVGVPAK
jgi:mono/diheme cytochrome c family protein